MDDGQFAQYVEEQTNAPVCGPCIVVASHIRKEAGVLIAKTTQAHGTSAIHPVNPAVGYRMLADTRWGLHFDPEPPEQLNDESFYRACVIDHYTDRWLKNAATEDSEATANWRESTEQHRLQWRESITNDESSRRKNRRSRQFAALPCALMGHVADEPTGVTPTQLSAAVDGTEAITAWSLDDGEEWETPRRFTPARITWMAVAASLVVLVVAGAIGAYHLGRRGAPAEVVARSREPAKVL